MKKFILILITIIALLTLTNSVNSNGIAIQTTVLSGVVSRSLVHVGQEVKEGNALIMVNSLIGESIASRANTDGKVVEILVRPGDAIRNGDIVVKIESK